MDRGKTAKKKRTAQPGDSLRLDPEKRLCPQFDSTGIKNYPVASWDKVGWQVVDDCAQEHIQ